MIISHGHVIVKHYQMNVSFCSNLVIYFTFLFFLLDIIFNVWYNNKVNENLSEKNFGRKTENSHEA